MNPLRSSPPEAGQTPPPATRERKIDPARAVAMAEAGCTAAVIARRLGCCRRHARRLTSHVTVPINTAVGSRHEHRVWSLYHRMWGSYADVAYAFGVTRQAVHTALTN